MKDSLTRLLSGIIYISIIIFSITHSDTTWFHLLFSIIPVLCIYEITKLTKEKSILPYLYIIIPFSLIHLIEDKELILYIFILTWTFDSLAYILGSKIGKNKISSISPNKSLEGFISGFIATLIIGYIIIKYNLLDLSKYNQKYLLYKVNILYLIGLLIPFTATIGDLIESYYKREANVKDSGRIIPGHGGILDRVDSITITIPIIYLLTYLI